MSHHPDDDMPEFIDRETSDREEAINRKGWAEVQEQVRRDHAGQYVALAFGRIVAAGPEFDEVVASVKRLEPRPVYYLVFPAEEGPIFEPVESSYSFPFPIPK